MKRLWIGEPFRGLGLGRKLVLAAIAWAQEVGYDAIYLDTAPAAMPAAEALYRSLGFQQVSRYNSNPVADIIFFRLGLDQSATPPAHPECARSASEPLPQLPGSPPRRP